MATCVLAHPQLSPAQQGAWGPVLAGWIYEAGKPFADWYFGDPQLAAEITAEWIRRPTSELYLGHAHVLLRDATDGPAGCLIGLPGRDLPGCRAADFAAFCDDLGSGPEADAVLDEVVPAGHALFHTVTDDHYYISRITIDPVLRGNGLGQALIDHVLEQTRRDGFRHVSLNVWADNVPAMRLYRSAGFRIVDTGHSPAAAMSYHSMTLDL